MKGSQVINYITTAILLLLFSACEDAGSNDSLSAGNGKGGSMAQFTVYNGQLYLLQGDQLQTYSLQNPAAPVQSSSLTVGQDAETLFPYNGNLFIGTQNGMHIYSLAKPAEPSFISTFRHVTSCDPVVVEGNFAYLTLRSGTPCNFGVNELQVLDVSDLENPRLISTMLMQNPQGLAVNDGILYVCNGDAGLTVFNVYNPYDPKILKEYRGYNGYDVIFTSRSLMMVGTTGLVQYDAADPLNLRQLSVIPVEPLL